MGYLPNNDLKTFHHAQPLNGCTLPSTTLGSKPLSHGHLGDNWEGLICIKS
jgi:hypothetical protein